MNLQQKILIAIIGFAGTIGAALITKGFFDNKIEKDYTPKEEITTKYTPNAEVKLLDERILALENQLKLEREKQPREEKSNIENEENEEIKVPESEPKNTNETKSVDKVEVGDWLFELEKCKLIGNSLECTFYTTSRYQDRQVTIMNSSRIYDDTGNEYKYKIAKIANKEITNGHNLSSVQLIANIKN